MKIRLWVITLASLMLAGSGWAAPVYKTVDDDGNVKYSSSPPTADAKAMDLLAGPSEAQVQEAKKRQQKTQQQADQLSKDRAARKAGRNKAIPVSKNDDDNDNDNDDDEVGDGGYNGYNGRVRPIRPRPPISRPIPRPRPVPRGN